jgi:AzlC protein
LGSGRHVRDDVRRLGAVRGGVDPAHRRQRRGDGRGSGAAELALRPDQHLGCAALPRASERRLVESQLIADESWAVSARPAGGFDLRVLLGAGLLLYPCWVGGTALGVVGGGLLGDPNTLGLDGAFPALFLALLAPQVRKRRPLVAACVGGAIALALVPILRLACRSSSLASPASSGGHGPELGLGAGASRRGGDRHLQIVRSGAAG